MYLRLLLLFNAGLLAIGHLKSQTNVRSGKDYAVFFYVFTYDQVGWIQLPEVKSESERIAAELSGKYGFMTELVPGSSKKQIIAKMDEYNRRQYGPSDQVLFFFSMHGHYDATADRGYLIPKEGKVHDSYGASWLSYDELGALLARNTSKHVLLMLDACYSGSFGIRNRSKPDGPVYDEIVGCAQKIDRAMKETSRKYFSSGNKSSRTPARSVFASRILETLRKGSEEGILYTRDFDYALSGIDNPKPESGSFRGHEENGDFVFVLKGACASEQEDKDALAFKSAQSRNTIEAYDYYLSAFPQGRFKKQAEDAGAMLQEDHAWRIAQRLNTPDAYLGYLDIYPYGRYTTTAGLHIVTLREAADYGAAVLENTLAAYLGFLEKYPGSPRAEDVQRRINVLQAAVDEAQAWEVARRESTSLAYRRYLESWPEGRYAAEAVQLLEGAIGVDEVVRQLEVNMIRIRGGTFIMGCRVEQGRNCSPKELPAHKVTVSDFSIGKYEVTQKEWWAVMGTRPSYFKNCNNCPVENISWNDIQKFLSKLKEKTGKTFRLPSEAEWEYAARGGSLSQGYPFSGKNLNKVAWYWWNSEEKTHPVGQKRANELGIYDMSGNVYECCEDDMHYDYIGAPDNGSAWVDMRWANVRVVRGGSFHDLPRDCSNGHRWVITADLGARDTGFRLVRTQ